MHSLPCPWDSPPNVVFTAELLSLACGFRMHSDGTRFSCHGGGTRGPAAIDSWRPYLTSSRAWGVLWWLNPERRSAMKGQGQVQYLLSVHFSHLHVTS